MLKGLLRSLLENSFIIFSFLAILSAFVYVVVFPTLAANGSDGEESGFSVEGLIEDSTPSPSPSQVRQITVNVTGTVAVTRTVVATPNSTVKSIPTSGARISTPSPTPKPATTPAPATATATASPSPAPSARTPTSTATKPPQTAATSVVRTPTAIATPRR